MAIRPYLKEKNISFFKTKSNPGVMQENGHGL